MPKAVPRTTKPVAHEGLDGGPEAREGLKGFKSHLRMGRRAAARGRGDGAGSASVMPVPAASAHGRPAPRPGPRRGQRPGIATACVVALAWAATSPAVAHGLDGGDLSSVAWQADGWELSALGLAALLYALGLARLWRRAGPARGVRGAQVVAFVAGWLALAFALLGPLDALSEALFSAHMVQHEVLMIVAAPLLVLGHPLGAWIWAFPRSWRAAIGAAFHRPGWRAPWRALTAPPAAWVLHLLALWLWHLPALFGAALAHRGVHVLQHLSFLGTALLFWWSVIGTHSTRQRGMAWLSIFTTLVHTGALGALLTLSQVLWYPAYAATAPQWGLTALQDQQLGGIVMWVPAGAVYLGVLLVLSARALAASPPVAVRLVR